ncbi:Ig-like domain-containing protein [Longilinea arvoryzae]|uniref:Ig-like domain-containing protein n=1 Tax=Longilinea arvoryzae TaxID=360412 RepID=UPI0009467BF7|nr:Ig-like domain-containing protein [Longilinea arvoryzae]
MAGIGSDFYRGLTGIVNGTTVTLYATRKGGNAAIGGGELVSLVDGGGYNAAFSSSTPTLLATAAANTAFRGVALAPVASGPADSAPIVSSTTPANNLGNVPEGDSITVTFSEDVTTTAAAFTINCGGADQPFTFSGSGATYTLDPNADLPYSQTCTVTVTGSGVTDLDEPIAPMAADYSWSFTVVDLAPSVTGVVPAINATKVAVNTNISITFNKDVSTSDAAFALACDGTSQPFAFSGSGAAYTLDPTNNLPYSQVCSVTVTGSSVTDPDTNEPMAADYTWNFTTINDPDAITPIAEARAAGAGWTGTIQGNVTTPPGIFRSNGFTIQDATGGMYIFSGSLTLPALTLGDVVKVSGTIKNYNGMLETDPTTSVTWIDSGSVPDPTPIATGSVVSTQGKLISVTGTATWTGTPTNPPSANFSITLDDGSGPVIVYAYKFAGLDLTKFTSGQQLRVIGYSSYYKTSTSESAQIYPRYQSDIIDMSAPAVISTIPADAVTDVSPYKPLSAVFNKAMDPSSLDSTSFSLRDSTDAPVSGTVTYDPSTYTASFTPNAALSPTSTYTATISTAVRDSLGVTLANPVVWSFTTGELDSTSPTISDRSPAPDATNVPLSTKIVVTFSEELHASSLNTSHFVLTDSYGQVAANLSYDPIAHTVTLAPETNLLPTTEYTFRVTGNTADLAGNTLGDDDSWTFMTSVEPPMQVYFGDLHNHTSYSDGSGTPTQALAAGKAAGFDFMAISDHSYAIDDTEWANTLQAVNDATTSDFVGLRGFEYTQGAEGHINVWNSERHATRTSVAGCTYCDYTPNLEAGQTVTGFYPWLVASTTTALDEAGMVMQFNHPGWINFNDWRYHPELSGIARLEEVGNGSSTSYVFSENEYIRSLDYGWKLGATNNADTHSPNWGVNTDHRTGVLMTELTKAALLDALNQRRTFATEDKNFNLTMKANGAWMGSEIANSGRIQFDINGSDPDNEATASVQIITDQGKVVDSTQPAQGNFTWQPVVNVSTGVHYFYVKVTQADGDRIVTSPVWTLGTEDIAISDVVIQPTIPTVYSPSLLTARVTNRVDSSRTVNVVIKVNGVALGSAVEVTVPANGDGYVNFSWQPTEIGDVTVTAEIGNAPAGDNPDDNSASLNLTVTDEHLPLILIDAGHGNVNASGRDMGPFIDDLSAHQFNVLKNLDELTASDLNPDVVKLLVITAPQTAYTAAELESIANFVNAGGNLLLCGLADYTGKVPWADTVANRENAILDRIESATGQTINMRMNDDEVIDGNTNNGYPFGVIWQDFPSADTTGIGVNVENVSTWSLNSIRGRSVNDPLTADTPGVQIVMQGDLDEGYTADSWKNPFHTSNTSADGANDAYIYNPTWVSPATKPANAIPLPGAAVTQLQNGAGRIMLYGDSNDPFTIFAYTAGDGKQNELFNLQSIMWLLGTPLQKSTIAEARTQTIEDQPDNLNRLVWVEGNITAAYGEFFNVLYVQDATGGITVHAPAGDIDPTAFTRGTHVRVIGTIDTYNGDTEIQFFEAEMVQVIDSTHTDPAPAALSTHTASAEASEGWLVTVTGVVIQKISNDTIIVNDGTGPVRVFLDGYNGTFDDILVFDRVQVVGLASEDGDGSRIRIRNYKFHPGIADDVTVLGHTEYTLYLPMIGR